VPPMGNIFIAETSAWVDRAVVGLNLCPFAKASQAKGRVRYVLSEATHPEALMACLIDELKRLAETSDLGFETTLLIHPHVLTDFADYNDFLGLAEGAVSELGLEGVVQVASFHPQYQFAGSAPDDLSNATNRSPYPTLHLIREDSIERAVAAFPRAEAIFEANVVTMQRLGAHGWAALQKQCRADGAAAIGQAAGPDDVTVRPV
jgi:hypothetical protein